ncbi:MAG: hypothetical protein WBI41_05955 [Azovibrio sp.]|uniref:hypothetical protein n=1 Tax=Azovibrio sp. TaxID=1872673 RepID=UPI003C777BED
MFDKGFYAAVKYFDELDAISGFRIHKVDVGGGVSEVVFSAATDTDLDVAVGCSGDGTQFRAFLSDPVSGGAIRVSSSDGAFYSSSTISIPIDTSSLMERDDGTIIASRGTHANGAVSTDGGETWDTGFLYRAYPGTAYTTAHAFACGSSDGPSVTNMVGAPEDWYDDWGYHLEGSPSSFRNTPFGFASFEEDTTFSLYNGEFALWSSEMSVEQARAKWLYAGTEVSGSLPQHNEWTIYVDAGPTTQTPFWTAKRGCSERL